MIVVIAALDFADELLDLILGRSSLLERLPGLSDEEEDIAIEVGPIEVGIGGPDCL
jgi:hypothetical protein